LYYTFAPMKLLLLLAVIIRLMEAL